MGKKYIIKLDDNKLAYTAIIIDGVPYIKPLQLLPYTEPDLEQVRKEAFEKGYSTAVAEQECAVRGAAEKGYQKGLSDAWEAARKIACDRAHGGFHIDTKLHIFGASDYSYILANYSAPEATEKIKQYEQKSKEEKPISVEDVMREYLYTYCEGRSCIGCLLHTDDFTCGRGYHFSTTNSVSDEEVRRAYTKVLQEKRES